MTLVVIAAGLWRGGGGAVVVVMVEEEEGGQGVARIASVEVAGSLTGEGGTHPN